MKIISKHKDYYDYLQGIYGMDTVITYDRRRDNILKQSECLDPGTLSIVDFAICGNIMRLHYYKNKVYYTQDELIELDAKVRKDTDDRDYLYYSWGWKRDEEKNSKEYFDKHNYQTDVNKKLREPVLASTKVRTNNRREDHEYEWLVPDLGSFGIASIIPAEKMFIDISNFMGWLVDNPPIPDNMTNKEKINSHGFDMKKSFRHRK